MLFMINALHLHSMLYLAVVSITNLSVDEG